MIKVNTGLLNSENIPKHIAIIMDGNRRWAKKRHLPIKVGHYRGAEALDRIVSYASEVGVETLTVFAFSTENWARSKEEIDTVLELFKLYLIRKTPAMVNHGVKLELIGDLRAFPLDFQMTMQASRDATKDCKKIRLVLALNYGARDEITRAISKIVNDLERSNIKKEDINENLVHTYLDTSQWKDPDLLIRTSGEQRVSNFLLWQMSYTELYMTNIFWPDFRPSDFRDAIIEYQSRLRRFGE